MINVIFVPLCFWLLTAPRQPLTAVQQLKKTDQDTGRVHVTGKKPTQVIKEDIKAQDGHDWSRFLAVRTNKSGPPENRIDYETLRQKGSQNSFLDNIISARLVGAKAIPLSLAQTLTRIDRYVELYGRVEAYYVGIDYKLKEENRPFYNGVNYRLYILALEEGQWVIIEASEVPVSRIVEAGYGFGTSQEKRATKIQDRRNRTNKFRILE